MHAPIQWATGGCGQAQGGIETALSHRRRQQFKIGVALGPRRFGSCPIRSTERVVQVRGMGEAGDFWGGAEGRWYGGTERYNLIDRVSVRCGISLRGYLAHKTPPPAQDPTI